MKRYMIISIPFVVGLAISTTLRYDKSDREMTESAGRRASKLLTVVILDKFSMGTGTILFASSGRAVILTAKHVIEDGSEPHYVQILYNKYDGERLISYKIAGGVVVKKFQTVDMAIIAAGFEPDVEFCSKIRDHNPTHGELLWTNGLRGNIFNPNVISGSAINDEYGWLHCVKGQSGSGIFSDDGQLVGLMVATKAGQGCWIPAGVLTGVLRPWLLEVLEQK